MKERHLLALSGGKDSAALAVYMREKYADLPMEYVFIDSGCELPETYAYLDKLRAILGIEIINIRSRRNFEYWLKMFKQVYGTASSNAEQVVTTQNVFDAIGEYERSQTFTRNPWQAYVKGNNQALSDSAKRGAILFYKPYQQGGGNCVACHKGDKFTDEKFYNIALPQLGKGGRGGADNTNDYGRGNETKAYADRFTFRTPSLLNVEGTAPYSHAGAFYTLEGVIQHHLDPAWSIANYKFDRVNSENPGIQTTNTQTNTLEALGKLREDQANGLTPLRTARLSKTAIEDLANFLRSLTDPCIKSADCLAPWIPPLNEDPNGLQLDAQFNLSARP